MDRRPAARALPVDRRPRRRRHVALDWDADVSRIHAELELLGHAWTVADDGLSRNGTYVNGDRIRGRRRLVERDQVRFGATTVVFRAPDAGLRPTRTQVTAPGAGSGGVAISPAQRRVLVALARPCLAPRRVRHPCHQPRDRRGALPLGRSGQDAPAGADGQVRHPGLAPEPQARAPGRVGAAAGRDLRARSRRRPTVGRPRSSRPSR